MKFIADLHTHSHYSRATSKTLDPEHLSLWAQKKGITVVGTGDFTHPGWVAELVDKLVESPDGLYQLRPELQQAVDSQIPPSCPGFTRFLLSAEISCIYKKNGRTRKLHHLILMPDIASVLRLNRRLDRIGNISSDGRPILGLDSKELLEITLETCERAFFIPAHIWTPWFSLFGSKSGFDTIEECFEDLTGHIYALETGLSSDPPMNRCLSVLDRYVLVSNSDAHSPGKLGREANIFDTDIDYDHIIRAMTDGSGFAGTIEFFPEEGKYHLDGHRKCGVVLEPKETLSLNGICPVCKRPLTVGVLNRVHELSDRNIPRLSEDFFSLIPLVEVLSELIGYGPATKKVSSFYERLISELGPELEILTATPIGKLEETGGPLLAEAIARMRRSEVIRQGGYDGEFGTIRLFRGSEKEAATGQMALFPRQRDKTPGPSRPHGHPKGGRGKRKRGPTVSVPASPADPILEPLNREQQRAVLHTKGHLLVVAGPGTGKTLTLTHRIAHLVLSEQAGAEQVLALTFTRKASREMEQRIFNLLKGRQNDPVRVSTFHRFCLEILRNHGHRTDLPHGFALCSEIDAANIARDILSGNGKPSLKNFVKALAWWKTQRALQHPAQEAQDEKLILLCRKYHERLRESGMLDLDDLETEALRLLRDHPEVTKAYGERYPWVFVDEYQDTNLVQVQIIKSLIEAGSGDICAIGDPDQAIYGFRGADVENFHRFFTDFPGAKSIELKRNYRSTEFILKGSAAILGGKRPLQPELSRGDPISTTACRTESEEAEMIVEQVERLIGGTSSYSLNSGRVNSFEKELYLGFNDIAVLYRLNAQGDALEEALDRSGIPFVRSGEAPLVEKDPVNILWRFFQTLRYPDNTYYNSVYTALTSGGDRPAHMSSDPFHIDTPLTGILDRAIELHRLDAASGEGLEALQRLRDLAADHKGDFASFLDTLSLERGIDHGVMIGDRLPLMSIHAAKGLEWEVTFITGCEDGLLPYSLFGKRDMEEERRLFYVGMTRARSSLILSYADQRAINGRSLKMKPSPFINAIPERLRRPLDRRGWKPKKRPPKQLTLF